LVGGCALVTGASRGIGAATAVMLAGDGWTVGVNYRADVAGGERVVDQIEAAGGAAVLVAADVRDVDAVERAFETLEERAGPVLVVVNNAGTRSDSLCAQLDEERWGRVVDTNLNAVFRVTRRALPAMIRARFGRIVNVASIVGPRASAGQASYAASKAGLIGFTKTVAAEVARRGITVNAVAPGFVRTALTADVGDDMVRRIPARRTGTPKEIASCIRFLTTEEASYVTGETLGVSGGLGMV
jgi:3-oxoacyl-[acyl-carrier protein] reductase